MFAQRYAINENRKIVPDVAMRINRKLSATVQKLVARHEPTLAVTECENGVCNLSWKPQRPAA